MGTYPSIPYQNLASQFLSFVLNKLYSHTHPHTRTHTKSLQHTHTNTRTPLKNTHFFKLQTSTFSRHFSLFVSKFEIDSRRFFNQKDSLHFSKSGRIILTLTLEALGRRFWEALLVSSINLFSQLKCLMDIRIAACLSWLQSLRHLTKSLTCYGQRVRSGLVVLLRY